MNLKKSESRDDVWALKAFKLNEKALCFWTLVVMKACRHDGIDLSEHRFGLEICVEGVVCPKEAEAEVHEGSTLGTDDIFGSGSSFKMFDRLKVAIEGVKFDRFLSAGDVTLLKVGHMLMVEGRRDDAEHERRRDDGEEEEVELGDVWRSGICLKGSYFDSLRYTGGVLLNRRHFWSVREPGR